MRRQDRSRLAEIGAGAFAPYGQAEATTSYSRTSAAGRNLACLCAALALASCGGMARSSEGSDTSDTASVDNEYVGSWQQTRISAIDGKTYMQYLDIQRSDATFLLNFHSPTWMGINGTYPATMQNGMLHPATPQVSDIMYVRSSNTLLVNGAAFTHAGS